MKAFLGVTKSLDELGHQGIAFQPTLRTILFTDLEGSTEMNRQLGDERALAVRRRHDEIIGAALATTGGRQVKTLGDGVLACFMSVVKALECAVRIQQGVASIAGADWPLRVRVGLAAGEPVADGDDLFGLAVNLASRVCNACEPGCHLRHVERPRPRRRQGPRMGRRRRALLQGLRRARARLPLALVRLSATSATFVSPSHKSGPRHTCRLRSSAASDEGDDNVRSVAVEVPPAPVVDRRCPGVCVPGGELHVPQRHPGVEGGHDQRGPKHVRVHRVEAGPLSDGPNPAVRGPTPR